MPTFSNMKTTVARRLGDDNLATLAGEWLNFTQRQMVPLLPWRELVVPATIAVSTMSTQLPSGFVKMMGRPVFAVDGLPLFRASQAQMRRQDPTAVATKPRLFFVRFDQATKRHYLEVYPEPDVSYTLDYDYLTTAVDMSGASDTPVFPEVYHYVLEGGAIEIGRGFENKADEPLDLQKFTKYLTDAVAHAVAQTGNG